jgi:hypothetical protein
MDWKWEELGVVGDEVSEEWCNVGGVIGGDVGVWN